jgi:hypothetical protein
LLQFIFELGLQLANSVLIGFLKLVFRDCVAIFVDVPVRSESLETDHFVELVIVKKQNFFFSETVVLFRDICVLEPGLQLAVSDDFLAVKVVIFLKQAVQILLLVIFLIFIPLIVGQSRNSFELGSLVLVFSGVFALLTPVSDLPFSNIGRALFIFANVDPL